MIPTFLWYILGSILLLSILAYLLQEKFIFRPEILKADFAFKYEIPFREYFFDSAPGVRINGLHFYRDNPKGLILYFHGNTRSIKGWARYAKDFYRYDYDVVLGFATKVASDNNPRYLILDAPYFNFKKVIERFLPFLPVRLVLRYQLRSDKWLPQVKCHTYIIHGTRDRLIPIRHSIALQAQHPRKTTLIRIEGGGHNNLPSFDEYHNFIRDILKY